MNGFLQGAGFNAKQDALLVYSDIAGLPAALGARAFGNPLLLSIYPGIEEANCLYVNTDPGQYEQIFLILTRALPAQMETCISARLEAAPQVKTFELPFFEYRSETDVVVKVIGPYRLKPREI